MLLRRFLLSTRRRLEDAVGLVACRCLGIWYAAAISFSTRRTASCLFCSCERWLLACTMSSWALLIRPVCWASNRLITPGGNSSFDNGTRNSTVVAVLLMCRPPGPDPAPPRARHPPQEEKELRRAQKRAQNGQNRLSNPSSARCFNKTDKNNLFWLTSMR